MQMLDLSLGLLLFIAALFLTLIYLLNEMLYKPLLAFMDKREESIRADMKASDENSEEIEAAQAEALEKISVAKNEASKIREEALNIAKEKASQKLEESKTLLEEKYEAFVKELSKERDELKKSLSNKENISEYAGMIKAKIENI
jgi:F-type H+-transporting ATPase subunit b